MTRWRGHVLLALLLAATTPPAEAEQVRFSPGPDAPVAYESTTGLYREGASFDPLYCAEEPCIELLHNIFEPLVATAADQTIEAGLATAWERRDERTWRFTLRRGVRFHNGETFDAEAVRFSLIRSSEAYGATAWFPVIERVTVLGPYRVEVVLAEPDSLFLYRLANIGLILPPRYFKEVGASGFGERPVGTGAFRFERWDAARREVHLAANRDYWREGYPRLDGLVYVYAQPDHALDMLIRGKLDLIRRLNPRRTTQFMATGVGRVEKAWLPQLVLGPFNLLKPGTPLRDAKVRRAINLAINREHLIRYGTIGNGRLIGGYTVPEDPAHAGLAPYAFNAKEARALLVEAGHGGGLILKVMVDRQVPPRIENVIAASLGRIGITVEVRRAGESEFLEELYLPKFGAGTPPSFDILLLSMPVGTIFHSAMVPMTLLYSRQPNESALRDPTLDRMYEAALHDPDPGTETWREIETYIYDNHFLFIGYQERAVFGVRKSLQFVPRTLMNFWDAYYDDGAE
jgi:peptide/nickel transport system substrate-binding protein